MKVEYKTQVFITPDKGQGVMNFAQEISKMKAENNAGDEIFVNLPNGKIIAVKGVTAIQIRDSICSKYDGTKF